MRALVERAAKQNGDFRSVVGADVSLRLQIIYVALRGRECNLDLRLESHVNDHKTEIRFPA